MKLTLKTITGLDPELVASSTLDPASILMELEARFNREEPEALFDDLQITHGLLPRIPRAMLRRQFGKWLPKGADAIVAATNEYLTEHAKERGYPLDASDLIASTVFNVQRIADLEKWKAEQTVIRRAQRHYLKSETSKQLVDGKKQWVDATVYELPPLMQSEGKSLKHEDARYAIRLPDGRYFDLGQTDGSFKPILSDGPDIAMQRIAKRAGLTLRGGAHSIVQVLTGLTGIIPAYTTVWHRHQWLVIVGWQRDPKTTLSSYYKGDNELSKAGDPDDRLTLSELDYQLLKGAAETEVQDFDGEVVDYLNEEEELVLQGLVRDEDDAEDPVDNPLLTAVAEHLGLLLELRIGSAVWTHPELESVILYMLKETRKEHTKLLGRIRYLRWKNAAVYKTMFKGKPRPQFRNKEAFLLNQIRPIEKKLDEYSVLLKQAEANGDRKEAKAIRKERSPYMKAMALRRTQLKRFRLISRFKDNLDDLRAQCEWHTTRSWTNVHYDGFTVALENHKPECPPHQGFGSMRGMEKTTDKPAKWDESMTAYEIPKWQPRPEAMPLRELHRLRYLAASDLETGAQAFNWEISTDPCMTIQPANVIQLRQPEVTHVDQLPESEEPSKRYSWQHGLSPRVIDKRMREARKGHAFRSVLDGSLKAQLAFSSSFEKALRA